MPRLYFKRSYPFFVMRKQDMAISNTRTRPRQRRRGHRDWFKFSKSQISPAYGKCLYNIVHELENRDRCVKVRILFTEPKIRKKPFTGEPRGTDSNAISRAGGVAGAEYSPRGFKVGGWVLHDALKMRDPGQREGTLTRRSPPPPKDRMFYPTLIRTDKSQQKQLERISNRETAIKILQDAQLEYYMAKLGKEEAQERKLQKVAKSIRRIRRKKEVTLIVENVLRQMEQVKIEEEVGIIVHERMMATRIAVC